MKLRIKEDPNVEDIEVVIKCREVDNQVKKIADLINTTMTTLIGKKDNESFVINLNDVYYFEAVENRVFACAKIDVYEVSYKITDLIELLEKTSFIQTSRTVILNLNKISKVHTLVNGRIMAYLSNNEKMIITRVYANDFKNKLKG